MNTGSLARAGIAALAGLTVACGPVLSQHSNTVARTTIGLSVGYVGGTVLWDVPDQNIRSSLASSPDDTAHIRRTLQPNLTIRADAAHYTMMTSASSLR